MHVTQYAVYTYTSVQTTTHVYRYFLVILPMYVTYTFPAYVTDVIIIIPNVNNISYVRLLRYNILNGTRHVGDAAYDVHYTFPGKVGIY